MKWKMRIVKWIPIIMAILNRTKTEHLSLLYMVACLCLVSVKISPRHALPPPKNRTKYEHRFSIYRGREHFLLKLSTIISCRRLLLLWQDFSPLRASPVSSQKLDILEHNLLYLLVSVFDKIKKLFSKTPDVVTFTTFFSRGQGIKSAYFLIKLLNVDRASWYSGGRSQAKHRPQSRKR